MNTLQKILKPIVNREQPIERSSLRFQDGVEIHERESIQKYIVSATVENNSNAELPRLVVLDPEGADAGLIAKTRADIADLVAILKAVTALR